MPSTIANHKILGPIIATLDSAVYYTESDLEVQFIKETKTRNLGGTFGDNFDDTLLDIRAEIRFRPSQWKNTDKLFALLALRPGARVFGSSDKACVIQSITEGQKYTFPRAAITGLAGLGLGVTKDLLGEITITCLRANAKDLSDSESLVKVETSQSFADTSFDRTTLFDVPFAVTYGEGDILDAANTEDGVDISFDIGLEDVFSDQDGVFDMKVTGQRATATLKPMFLTEANLLALAKVQGEGVRRGAKMSGLAADLVIEGLNEGEPSVTLHSCYVQNSGLQGGIRPNTLSGPMEFVTVREFSSGVTLGPIATIGTVEGED